jgi:hypothetical protein
MYIMNHVVTSNGTFQLDTPSVGELPVHTCTETKDRCIGDGSGDKLHVIVAINNYVRFKRRYELFWKFKADIEKIPHVVLHVVEIAFGDRAFMVTDKSNPNHVQLRTKSELWHKENSINLAVQRLPSDWKYVAWIDGDIQFMNLNFAAETIHQLQHYKIVQLFQSVCNLGAKGEVISMYKGFCWQYVQGKQYNRNSGYEFWHPGFAWAATREAWNEMGGLIDFAILGAGDHHMALSLIGKGADSMPENISTSYRDQIMEFQDRCETDIKRNIGYVDGTIIHNWHGKFKNRKYIERWAVITNNKFDPNKDIHRDWQGLFTIDSITKINLRDGIRSYFRQRNEDSVDNEE